MDRKKAVPLVIGLLCVLAIGLAASTLDNTVQKEGGGLGGSDEHVGSGGEGPDFDLNLPSFGNNESGNASQMAGLKTGICVGLLNNAYFVGFIFLLYGLWLRHLYTQGIGVFGVVGLLVTFSIFFIFVHAFLTQGCHASITSPASDTGLFDPSFDEFTAPEQGGSGISPGPGFSTPTLILLIVLGLASLGGIILLVTSTSDDDKVEEELIERGEVEEPDLIELGRVAGEAADRIESDAKLTNEVYRAWSRMTHYLNVENPESSTPREFAGAAVEAGMEPEDVEKLTELFDEVRYGGFEATKEREEAAVRALRNIEEEYARDETDDDRR